MKVRIKDTTPGSDKYSVEFGAAVQTTLVESTLKVKFSKHLDGIRSTEVNSAPKTDN